MPIFVFSRSAEKLKGFLIEMMKNEDDLFATSNLKLCINDDE